MDDLIGLPQKTHTHTHKEGLSTLSCATRSLRFFIIVQIGRRSRAGNSRPTCAANAPFTCRSSARAIPLPVLHQTCTTSAELGSVVTDVAPNV